MQIIKSLLVLAFLFQLNYTLAQSTYLPNTSLEYHLLDRLDIKNQDNASLSIFSTKPITRKLAVQYGQYVDSTLQINSVKNNTEITEIDKYNLDKLFMNNTECLSKPTTKYNSKKPWGTNFFTTKNNLYEVHTNDLTLYVNPMILQMQGFEMSKKTHTYLNCKGLDVRGLIGKKIGFYAMVTDNQENGPAFYKQRVDSLNAVPGNAFYKPFKTNKGQDYFDFRGYIAFKASKFIDVQYGFDKNFIGNGYRSLFLSDVAAPALFLKLNTKVWKLNYQNLFMELNPTFTGGNGGAVLDKKYAAMHHLSINLGDNATIGLFESVIFKRKNKFEFSYLIPVIFYRAVESAIGSGDNALLGADFKVNYAEHFQLYGQVLLDEFKLSLLKKKSWTNKVGIQAGLKYIDVADIKNLDLQIEWNIVRPYTYTHFDSATSYTHYNQPLAHPLGANFSDFLVIAKYQPANKLFFEAKLFVMQQGQDTTKNTKYTNGGNIFRIYNDRILNPINPNLQGVKASTINFSVTGAYEIRPNLYIDGSLLFRRFSKTTETTNNALMLSAGIRWNMMRRSIDY